MWTREYDPTIQLHYYINSEDNSISYDLPCEVQHRTPGHKKSSHFSLKRKISPCSGMKDNSDRESVSRKSSVLSRITSVLSRKSSNSSGDLKATSNTTSSSVSSATLISAADTNNHKNPHTQTFNISETEIDSDSVISGLDDDYLLESPINYGYSSRNYLNGYQSNTSIYSEESIHSYYSELVREDYYYEYEESVYDLAKEQERLEIRMQMRQELEI